MVFLHLQPPLPPTRGERLVAMGNVKSRRTTSLGPERRRTEPNRRKSTRRRIKGTRSSQPGARRRSWAVDARGMRHGATTTRRRSWPWTGRKWQECRGRGAQGGLHMSLRGFPKIRISADKSWRSAMWFPARLYGPLRSWRAPSPLVGWNMIVRQSSLRHGAPG